MLVELHFMKFQPYENTGFVHIFREFSGIVLNTSQMLFKIYVLKKFANFTGKHLSWSLFFRVLYNFIKNRLQPGVFL